VLYFKVSALNHRIELCEELVGVKKENAERNLWGASWREIPCSPGTG